MNDDDTNTSEAPTRRDTIKYGGAVITGGVLAGCAGQGDGGSTPTETDTVTDTPTDAEAGTDTPTETRTGSESPAESDTETQTSEDTSYSVTMAPVGEVEFETPPESIFTILAHHADMALALGRGDDVNAIFGPELFDGLYNRFLEHLDGVSVDWTELYASWNPSKERLFELDSDIHLEDPARVQTMGNWDIAAIEEVRKNISPWFGNTFSANHEKPPEEWSDRYEYYTLWEIFERVAAVFQEQERYRELADVHSNLISTIESSLPPADERPRVARILISPSGLEEGIWAYPMNGPGFNRAHTRVFGVEDPFDDMQVGGRIDSEALLEAEPEVILRTGGVSPGANWTEIKTELQNDPVTREIPAVKNDRVHPLGVRFGGPILNLYQLEMVAKEVYPEQFGEWPEYDGGSYPEFTEDEQLFDHQRVADIINGNL